MNEQGVDLECRAMGEAIDRLPGLKTVESCCGHGKSKFHIWLNSEDLQSLAVLAYWLMSCHGGNPDWTLQVVTDCSMDGPWFLVEGPIGERAYSEANAIAERIISDAEGDKASVVKGGGK